MNLHAFPSLNMLSSFEDEGVLFLKSEDNLAIIKGRKSEPVGSKKTWGGKEYMKTANGWKPVGKHGGAVKQAHDLVHGTTPAKVEGSAEKDFILDLYPNAKIEVTNGKFRIKDGDKAIWLSYDSKDADTEDQAWKDAAAKKKYTIKKLKERDEADKDDAVDHTSAIAHANKKWPNHDQPINISYNPKTKEHNYNFEEGRKVGDTQYPNGEDMGGASLVHIIPAAKKKEEKVEKSLDFSELDSFVKSL